MSFTESAKQSKWLLIGVGGVLVVALVAVLAFGGTDDQGDSASLEEMAEGEAGTVPTDENVLVLDENGRVVAVNDPSGAASGSNGSGSGGSGDSGSAQGDSPASPDPSGASPAPPPAPEGAVMTARVMFWDDTQGNSANGAQILIGDATWTPDTSGSADSTDLEDLPYDIALEMVILPNGSGGDRFAVPVMFTSIMEPGSERDAIHVEISDGEVRVIGNAVENFDARFDRS